MKAKFSILIIGLTVLISVTMLAGCQEQESVAVAESTSPGIPAVPVSVMVIEPVAMQDVIYLPGETEAFEDVQVAANIAGRVDWMAPARGSRSTRGTCWPKLMSRP